jgi:opacity protein-like surface antigen
VHAIVHMLNAIVRRPLPGRFQPYASAGYGMTVVLPGRSVNADPVTKNMVALGGGLEFYIRSDLAIRAEMRGVTVFGRQLNRDGVVAYDYLEQTVGLAFYRTLKP